MKFKSIVLSAVLLFISATGAQAESKTQSQTKSQGNESISSLILDLDEFKMLSVEDQAKYLIWSRELLATFEYLQAAAKSEKFASIDRRKDWSIEFSLFPQADAAFPLALLPYALPALRAASQAPAVLRFASQARSFSQAASRGGRARRASGVQNGGRVNAAFMAGSAVVAGASISALGDKNSSPPAASAPVEPTPKSAANVPEVPKAFEGEYREVNAKCLFGGHLSVFKKFGEQILCTRPKASINPDICKDPSKSFFCQSLGLSQGPSPKDFSSKLCVPLRNKGSLEDLTERCSAAFEAMFKQGPTMLNTEEFKKFSSVLKESAEKFEKETMRDSVTFQDYCKDGNAINKELQKSECGAMLGLIGLIKSDSKIEQVIATRKSTARGRGATPTKPAGATN